MLPKQRGAVEAFVSVFVCLPTSSGGRGRTVRLITWASASPLHANHRADFAPGSETNMHTSTSIAIL